VSHRIIGTCSLCGGRIGIPNIWHGIYPPEPQCLNCYAVAADSGPVIPMRQGPRIIAKVVPFAPVKQSTTDGES